MDMNSTLSRIALGFAVRVAAIGFAIWIASYSVIALCDALERVSQVLPK